MTTVPASGRYIQPGDTDHATRELARFAALRAAYDRTAAAGERWIPPHQEQARRDSRDRNRAARASRRINRRRTR